MHKMTWGALLAIAIAMAAAFGNASRQQGDRPSAGNLQALAVDEMAGLYMMDKPEPAPALQFTDAQGQARSLADYKDQVLLVNLWATWCAPCVKEMPALDRLAQSFAGQHFALLPISLDVGGAEAVNAFYAKTGISHLPVLIDKEGRSPGALGAIGLPMTVLIDKNGRVIARHPGDAEWDSPAAKTIIETLLAR